MSGVRFGVFTPPRGLGAIYRTAEMAEAGPWDSVWVPDHIVGWGSKLDALDPWTLLGTLAAKTKRVGLGIGVSDPHRRHPAVFAHQAMTLDQVSGGRLLLGVGAGEAMNLAPYGIPFDRAVSRFEEFLSVTRALWTQKMVTHRGTYYQLKNAPMAPKPDSLKLYIAGNAPRTMGLTARFGDGWLPFKRTPEVYRRDWEFIRAEAKKAGRDPGAIRPGLLLYTAISRDREEARKLALEQGRILLAVSPRRMREMGYEPPSGRLDAHRLTPLTDPSVSPELPKAMRVPERAIEESFVFGTPEDCVEGVRKFVEAGCRHFVAGILNPGRERDGAMELYAKEVIPHFAEG
ncbi:MAG: LLM class flavin-dependent oxidoreductase [Halobacteria archaeon]